MTSSPFVCLCFFFKIDINKLSRVQPAVTFYFSKYLFSCLIVLLYYGGVRTVVQEYLFLCDAYDQGKDCNNYWNKKWGNHIFINLFTVFFWWGRWGFTRVCFCDIWYKYQELMRTQAFEISYFLKLDVEILICGIKCFQNRIAL